MATSSEERAQKRAIEICELCERINPIKTFKMTVLGEPGAWKRERMASTAAGKSFLYDPNTSLKSLLTLQLKESLPEGFTPITGPLTLTVNNFKTKAVILESGWRKVLCEQGFMLPISKPDVDNYAKLVMDAFNKRFYKDDSQITEIRSAKFFSGTPRVEIIMEYRERSIDEIAKLKPSEIPA